MTRRRLINMLVCGVGVAVFGGICYSVLADHAELDIDLKDDDELGDAFDYDADLEDEVPTDDSEEHPVLEEATTSSIAILEQRYKELIDNLLAVTDAAKKVIDMKVPAVPPEESDNVDIEQPLQPYPMQFEEEPAYDARVSCIFTEVIIGTDTLPIYGLFTEKRIIPDTIPEKTKKLELEKMVKSSDEQQFFKLHSSRVVAPIFGGTIIISLKNLLDDGDLITIKQRSINGPVPITEDVHKRLCE